LPAPELSDHAPASLAISRPNSMLSEIPRSSG
jgi:hypothetical protein